VAGTIIADNLAVAGLSLDAHVFGAADVESVEFSDDSTSFDGLMGLAQSTLSNQQTLTPPEAMVGDLHRVTGQMLTLRSGCCWSHRQGYCVVQDPSFG